MIWGYDYSARLCVDLVLLVLMLSIIFIRRHIKRKKNQSEDTAMRSINTSNTKPRVSKNSIRFAD